MNQQQIEMLSQIQFYEVRTYPTKKNIPIKEQKLKRDRIKRQNEASKKKNLVVSEK